MKRLLATAAVGSGLVLASGSASAQSIIEQPNNHQTKVDVEVHGVFGYSWHRGWYDRGYWVGGGWGVGVRVGVPLMPNGPVRTINNSLMLNLGGELLFWSYYYGWDQAMELVAPLALQWNFYLLPAFSLFLEGGLALGVAGCCGFGFWPGLALGGRVHFNGRADYPALVFRVGFPVGFTLGVAF